MPLSMVEKESGFQKSGEKMYYIYIFNWRHENIGK